MADIRLNLTIKTAPEKVYAAVTTQEGLEGWWCKHTTAKPELEFVNVFIFGKFHIEMKVTQLAPNKKVEWKCLDGDKEWIGTTLSFDLEEKNGATLLRFTHGGYQAVTDTFATCS